MSTPDVRPEREDVGLAEVLAAHDIVFGEGDDEHDVDGAICDCGGGWQSERRSVDDLLAEHRAHVAAAVIAAGWVRAEDVAEAQAKVERVEAVLAEHWDWKAGRSLRAAVLAALRPVDAPEHLPECRQFVDSHWECPSDHEADR